MKPIVYHEEAWIEADEAASFYQKKNPQAAREFITILERIVADIHLSPQRWPYHKKTTLQRRHMKRFPYTIFYANESEKVFIIAIAHSSRRPGYWAKRVMGK